MIKIKIELTEEQAEEILKCIEFFCYTNRYIFTGKKMTEEQEKRIEKIIYLYEIFSVQYSKKSNKIIENISNELKNRKKKIS